MNNAVNLLLSLFLLISFSSFSDVEMSTDKSIRGWVKLGKQPVTEGAGYDEYVLTEEKKNVKRLKLKALKTSIYIASVKILYDDKTSENHIIKRKLDKGESTRVFNLIGHYRIIKKVIFIYGQEGKSYRNGRNGKAELLVMGKM